ncbi:MAG: glucoamylase family protein [Ferruginibacter sp.]
MKNSVGLFILTLSFFCSCISGQSSTKGHFDAATRPKDLSDSALLDLVQKQTFRYFWDFAHPVSGLARERSNTAAYGHETTTIGGTGFGVMSVIVATERKYISRDTAAKFLLKMLKFLMNADKYHGAFPHWMNGSTGKTIPFSDKDDGGDLVETSYLFQGLLCARQYFNGNGQSETQLREKVSLLWQGVEWDWYTRNGQDVLYWHWSPKNEWAMNFPVHGYNECLILYILSSASEQHPVKSTVYHNGWTNSNFFRNGKTYYGYELPLGFDYGGPLFFSHYSFLGLDPRGLKDQYADYWKQNQNHTLINYSYCVDNPKEFKGYGQNCWGLTAGDTYDDGYDAYSPANDGGTIAPTAALSAFPYTPDKSMKALKHFYYDLGDKIWSEYGFVDGFNETKNWYAKSHLAIDQGPIIVMIENYRSGLLWKLFMSCPEIQQSLKKLNFTSPWMKERAVVK